MKIAILFESSQSGGGAFTHSLNASLDLITYLDKKYEFVIFTHLKENLKTFKKHNISAKLYKHSFLDKIIITLSFFSFFRNLFMILNLKLSIETNIENNKFDAIFLPVLSKTVFALKKVKYVSTLLDLEHFQHSIFPEITKKDYTFREKLYFHSLPKSLLVVTSCESIKKNLCKHYQIDKNKVVVIPYTPGRFIGDKAVRSNKNLVKKYTNNKNYFFYPAQIWGHKNHIVILKAALILQKKGYNLSFIFSGKNRGFKEYLLDFIKKNDLKNIIFTGYISPEEMNYLYKNCKGVIFTSVFGPNAIPPLEAWSYKKPLIYNNKLQDDVTMGTALLVDIKDSKSVAKALKKIITNNYNKKIIKNGYNKLSFIKKNNKNRYKYFSKKLDFAFRKD